MTSLSREASADGHGASGKTVFWQGGETVRKGDVFIDDVCPLILLVSVWSERRLFFCVPLAMIRGNRILCENGPKPVSELRVPWLRLVSHHGRDGVSFDGIWHDRCLLKLYFLLQVLQLHLEPSKTGRAMETVGSRAIQSYVVRPEGVMEEKLLARGVLGRHRSCEV